jgi:hypothetical protein
MITGKRVYAHEIEPGDVEPSQVAYYKFDKEKQAWVKYPIFLGEAAKDAPKEGNKRDAQKDFPAGTAGTGLETTAIDIDGDGDIDLICPGKSGLHAAWARESRLAGLHRPSTFTRVQTPISVSL